MDVIANDNPDATAADYVEAFIKKARLWPKNIKTAMFSGPDGIRQEREKEKEANKKAVHLAREHIMTGDGCAFITCLDNPSNYKARRFLERQIERLQGVKAGTSTIVRRPQTTTDTECLVYGVDRACKKAKDVTWRILQVL